MDAINSPLIKRLDDIQFDDKQAILGFVDVLSHRYVTWLEEQGLQLNMERVNKFEKEMEERAIRK